jgi:hypothetical protein
LPKAERPKETLRVRLDKLHIELLNGYIPILGGSPGEVARSIIVDWLITKLGWDKIEEMGAMRGFSHIKTVAENKKK